MIDGEVVQTSKNGDDEVTFDEWIRCAVLNQLVKTNSYFICTTLQMDSGGKGIDMREFLLGINNFSGESRAHKVTFTFKLYDEDNNGF